MAPQKCLYIYCLSYRQYNQQNMIQPTLLPFTRKRVQNRWTQYEFSNLLRIIDEIKPMDVKSWRRVTEKMHELGPKRQAKCYKEKFQNYLEKKESQQLRKYPQKGKNILKYFQSGKSPKQISELTEITDFLVKKILKTLLTKIQNTVPKIIGKSLQKKISFNDYNFFAYIQRYQLEIISISKLQSLCIHWSALRQSKNEQTNQNPYFYQKTIDYIKRKVIQFNDKLNQYSTYFQDYLNRNKEVLNEKIKRNVDTQNTDYKSLFLASSNLLCQYKDEEDSNLSIQEKCQEISEEQIQPQKFKQDAIKTCLSLSEQTKKDTSISYKLSDFIMKKPPIQSFLNTKNIQKQINTSQSPPKQKLNEAFESNFDDYFFEGDYIFVERFE